MSALGVQLAVPNMPSNKECVQAGGCPEEFCESNGKCEYRRCFHGAPQKPCTTFSRVASCADAVPIGIESAAPICTSTGKLHCKNCKRYHQWGLPMNWYDDSSP